MLTVAPHPYLDARCFVSEFSAPLGALAGAAEITAFLAADAPAPLRSDEATRKAVRDLLRHGGFKPTGRSKPASEYLSQAAEAGRLSSINPAVDIGNAVSLHSGLPISILDLDRCEPPLTIDIAPAGSSYVFNPSGQVIEVAGLLCVLDAQGPCGNAVKDAQRTKTDGTTTRTLTVIWGVAADPDRTRKATAWYHELLGLLGARITLLP